MRGAFPRVARLPRGELKDQSWILNLNAGAESEVPTTKSGFDEITGERDNSERTGAVVPGHGRWPAIGTFALGAKPRGSAEAEPGDAAAKAAAEARLAEVKRRLSLKTEAAIAKAKAGAEACGMWIHGAHVVSVLVVCMQFPVGLHVHTYVHAHMHTHIYTHADARVPACIHACVMSWCAEMAAQLLHGDRTLSARMCTHMSTRRPGERLRISRAPAHQDQPPASHLQPAQPTLRLVQPPLPPAQRRMHVRGVVRMSCFEGSMNRCRGSSGPIRRWRPRLSGHRHGRMRLWRKFHRAFHRALQQEGLLR